MEEIFVCIMSDSREIYLQTSSDFFITTYASTEHYFKMIYIWTEKMEMFFFKLLIKDCRCLLIWPLISITIFFYFTTLSQIVKKNELAGFAQINMWVLYAETETFYILKWNESNRDHSIHWCQSYLSVVLWTCSKQYVIENNIASISPPLSTVPVSKSILQD